MGRERKDQASPYAEAKAAEASAAASKSSGKSQQTSTAGTSTKQTGTSGGGSAVRVTGGTQKRTPDKTTITKRQQDAWNKGQNAKITDPFKQGGVQLLEGADAGPTWLEIEGDAPKEVQDDIKRQNDATANQYLKSALDSLNSWNGSNPEAYNKALSYASYYKTRDDDANRTSQWNQIYNTAYDYKTREEEFGFENVNGFDNYLNSGNTNSEQTQKFIAGVDTRIRNATGEKDQMFWTQQKKALEKQLKADKKAEKPGAFDWFFDALNKASNNDDPYAGWATDELSYQNMYGKAPTDSEKKEEEEGGNAPGILNEIGWAFSAPKHITPGSAEDLANREAAIKAAEAAAGTDIDPELGPDLFVTAGDKAWTDREAALAELNEVRDQYYKTDRPSEADPLRTRMDELEGQVKALNQQLGYETYEGLTATAKIGDILDTGLHSRAANTLAGVGGVGAGIDYMLSSGTDEEEAIRDELRKAETDAFISGNPEDWDKVTEIQNQLDQYRKEHAGEANTALGDLAYGALDTAKWNEDISKQARSDLEADMSWIGKIATDAGFTIADVMMDIGDNQMLNGLGTFFMYTRAGGAETLEQMGKENNSPDALFFADLKGILSAKLSTKLVGGISTYGESHLGEAVDKWISKCSPEVQAVLDVFANTEGFEEGLEDVLNYMGDIALGLDPQAQLDFLETGMDTAIGYVVGVLTDGLASGVEYNSESRQNLGKEAIDFWLSGGDIAEARQAALDSTKDQVVMKRKEDAQTAADAAQERGQAQTEAVQRQQAQEAADLANQRGQAQTTAVQNQQNQQTAASQAAALEGQDVNPTAAPTQTSADIAWSQTAALEGQNTNPTAAPTQTSADIAAGQQATLEGQDTNPQAAPTQTSADIAQSQAAALEGQETNAKPAPAQTLEERMETGDVSEEEYMELLGTEEGREELAEALGTESSSPEDVANGLTVYLYLQQQGYLNPQGENQTGTSPDEVSMLLGEESTPKYGEDGFVNPMGEDIDEDENFQVEEEMEEDEDRPSLDELRAEMAEQEQAQNQNQEQNEVDLLPGTESEPQNATQTNPAPKNINTQAEQTNATEGVFNAQEGTENQGAGNANANPNENVNGNPNPNENVNENAETEGPQMKVSQFSTHSLKNEEGKNYRGDLYYVPETQAGWLLDAYNRLGENRTEEINNLTKANMWDAVQVKMGKVIQNELFEDAATTGDWSAYDAWREIRQAHSTDIAQALVAHRTDPELNAEKVYDSANNFLNEIAANPDSKVDSKTIDQARTDVREATQNFAKLELEEKKAKKQGKSDQEAWDQIKDRWLDEIDRIVSKRNVGLLTDMFKNKKIRKGVTDIETNMSKMLSNLDEDYVKRFGNLCALGMANDVKYKGKPDAQRVGEWVNGMQKLAMLGGTGTLLRNEEGNITFGVFDWVSNNTCGVALDQLMSLLTGQHTRGLEAGVLNSNVRKEGNTEGIKAILETAANIDLLDSGSTKLGYTSTWNFNPYNTNPINRFLARSAQALGYGLNATDAQAVGFAQKSASDAAKRRNRRAGTSITDEQADAIGKQEAEYRTYKNDTMASTLLQTVQNALDVIGFGGEVTKLGIVPVQRKGGFGLGTFVSPFIRVPVNIAMKLPEYSPVGIAQGVVNAGIAMNAAKKASNAEARVGENVSQEDAEKARTEALLLQNKASGQLGRGAFGTAIILGLSALMKGAKWFRNWNDEDDPDVKAQNKAEGKYGLQIDLSMAKRLLKGEDAGEWNQDTAMNIDAIEPLDKILAAASLISQYNDGISLEAFEHAIITGTLDSLSDLPAISNITTIADNINYNPVYTEDEEGNRTVDTGATWKNALMAGVGSSVSGFIPSFVRQYARIRDEYERDTTGNTPVDRALNQIKAAIPGLRETLPVKTDNFGNPVSAGDLGTRVANNLLANKYSRVNQSEVSAEIERLREETGVNLMPNRNGPSTVKFGDETVHLDSAERKEWKDEYGQDVDYVIDMLLNSSTDGAKIYQGADSDTQTELISEAYKYLRDGVKDEFANDNGYEFDSKYDDVRDLNNPITWLLTDTRFDVAMKNGDYDAIDDLIPVIGNMESAGRGLLNKKNSTAGTYYRHLTPNKDGYAVTNAEALHTHIERSKELANQRGVSGPSGADYTKDCLIGYRNKEYDDETVDAIMTYHTTQKDGKEDYDATKTRYGLYTAARDNGIDVETALLACYNVDADGNGYIKKAEIQAALNKVPANRRKAVEAAYNAFMNKGKKKK